MRVSAVQAPLVVKLAVMLAPPACGPMGSARASFRRAHDSRADPKEDAAVERVARARRYDLAEARRSEYACWEDSRSGFVRTAWTGRGAGGRGRLKLERGLAVDAME